MGVGQVFRFGGQDAEFKGLSAQGETTDTVGH